MNNERYNQIIDEAWKKYLDETRFNSNPEWLEPVPVMDMKTEEKAWGARQYHRNDFINKCKTDKEFSERWGLKIEERELSFRERNTYAVDKLNYLGLLDYGHSQNDDDKILDFLNYYNVPTREISLTYNNETIEVYE
jgi:hypothetical protein